MIVRLGKAIMRGQREARRGLRFWIYRSAEADVVRRFHMLYYHGAGRSILRQETNYLGVPVLKCPFDLWIYQEIIHRLRPDLIIETGTFRGGSALYMASICDVVGNGRIVSIDIESNPAESARHERITYLKGSSTSGEIVSQVEALARDCKVVMAVLDSAHDKDHVLNEIEAYGPLVTLGSYLVVEDTHLNGNPIRSEFGPGPMEALETFLETDSSFEIDDIGRKFLMTFNPNGYLVRVRE